VVMGVPGHDQRDWEFAKKFGLPIIEVVQGGDVTKEAFVAKDDTAIMVNSGFLNGMTVKEAIPAMKKYVVEQGFGKEKVNFKLRDWVFSRQRYWGEPIPLVNCEKCAGFRCRRSSCLWYCRRWRATSPPTTAKAPSAR